MLKYKKKEDFNTGRISYIHDIQFFDRIIVEEHKPAMMIEYRIKRELFPVEYKRELYEFKTKEERKKFYKEILKRIR